MSTMTLTRSTSLAGRTFNKTETQDYDNDNSTAPPILAAKTGTLTTRTSVSVGTLTMSSGHGITTAAKVGLYWINSDGSYGYRYNVTVGTVATNSVPFSLGTGNDLPLAATTIYAMVEHVETVSFVGDNVVGVFVTSIVPAVIQLQEGDGTVIATYAIMEVGDSFQWTSLDGSDNPVAGVTIGKIIMTHSDPSNTRSPVCTLAYN